MRDFIPDIHGDLDRLTRTLDALGYREEGGIWRHPAGRVAVFLGDLIDKGADNAAVIDIVSGMTRSGQGICLMGNHELNALLYHSRGRSASGHQDGWMRAHTASATRQHQAFLEEFVCPDALSSALDFFLQMPLIHMGGGMRAVHACWCDESVNTLLKHCPDGRIQRSQLQEIALEETALARAVMTLTKGPDIALPVGVSYLDIYGARRRKGRLKWWATSPCSIRDSVASVPDLESIPADPLPAEATNRFYPSQAPIVIFGHYKMQGQPDLEGNAICIDFPDLICALREDGGALELVRVPDTAPRWH